MLKMQAGPTKKLSFALIALTGLALCAADSLVDCDAVRRSAAIFELEDSLFERCDLELKKICANNCIEHGMLQGALLNGETSLIIRTGYLATKKPAMAKKIIERCLAYGDTITAAPPGMVSATSCERDLHEKFILNLSNKGLVTVRDIAYQKWFDNVVEINLSGNYLREVPARFFELFKNAKKYKFGGNPLTTLDTFFMPKGLLIVAYNTELKDIISNSLATGKFTFNVINTPLSKNKQRLAELRAVCKPKPNILTRCWAHCWGEDLDDTCYYDASQINS